MPLIIVLLILGVYGIAWIVENWGGSSKPTQSNPMTDEEWEAFRKRNEAMRIEMLGKSKKECAAILKRYRR